MRKHLIVLMVILSFGIHAQSQTVKITQEFIERIQKYTELDIFHDGMAAVCRDDSLWGYIDTEGNEVIPCMYNRHVGCFSEGLACVPSDDENGVKFINNNNEVVLDKGFKFGSRAECFVEDGYLSGDNVNMTPYGGVWNSDGLVFDDFSCFRLPCFINGFCTLIYPGSSTKELFVSSTRECDFICIDKEGNVSNTPYQYTLKFATKEDEYLCFERVPSNNQKLSWLIACNPIDEPNKYIPYSKEIKYDKDYDYSEHVIGLKNKKGEIVVPAIYTLITGFHDGVALVGIWRGSRMDLPSEEIYWNFGYVDEYGNSTFTVKDMQELTKCEQKIKADIKCK